MGGKRRRRDRELQLHGFSLPKIVERQCQLLNCIVTESLLKSSLQRMLLFKQLISTYVPNKDRTVCAMHRSLVTLLRRSCHMRIKYSTGTSLHYYML
jgi:hypothetical protein